MVETARSVGCFVQLPKSPAKPRRIRLRCQSVSSSPVYSNLKRTGNARSSLKRDLHVDPIGILDVQTGKVALQGSRAALCQIASDRFPRGAGNPNREMIYSAGRASDIERYQR